MLPQTPIFNTKPYTYQDSPSSTIMASPRLNFTILAIVLVLSLFRADAQVTTSCSASVMSTFTPCVNYITGSTGSGSPPTEECCNSVKSLMSNNMDCVCLIVTGNVPVSIPFVNANMAISLPRVCKSSVPLQCKASGAPLPAPGPVLFGPTRAPAARAPAAFPPAARAPIPAPHSHSPKASKAATAAAPPPVDIEEAAPPKFSLGPSANPGIRPVFNPKSSSPPSATTKLSSLVIIFVVTMAFNFF